MVTIKGGLEILELANERESKSFDDFTKILIDKKHLSSATVSKRLESLVQAKAMEEIITRSKSGRRIIAYRTTEKGRRIIRLAGEIIGALTNQKAK